MGISAANASATRVKDAGSGIAASGAAQERVGRSERVKVIADEVVAQFKHWICGGDGQTGRAGITQHE